MVKFCPECANPIIESNMPFCPKCGAKLPISTPEVQPSSARQPTAQQPVQQPVQKSSYTPPVNSVPTTFSERESSERSFYYSNKFYFVIILDFIISSLIGLACFSIFLDGSGNYYLLLAIIFLINLIIDIYIINNMRKSPHTININTCWIKSLFGFLGIFTVVSGVYFLIISISMKRAYDARIK